MSDLRSGTIVREIFLTSFMSGLPPSDLAWATPRLARATEDVHLGPGDVAYAAGDVASELFFVVSGELEVEAPGKPSLRFGERSLVGAFDVLIGRPRSRRATATRRTHLLRVGAGDWLDLLEDNFAMVQLAVRGLAQGVHDLRLELDDVEEPASQARLLSPRSGLDLVERVFTLRGVPLFGDADVQSLTSLAAVAHEAVLPPGTSTLADATARGKLVVVADGAVTVAHPKRSTPQTYGPGALVLGAIAAHGEELGYDARASIPTRVVCVAHEDYFDIMEEHFTLARSAIKSLASEREMLQDERGRRRMRAAQASFLTVTPSPIDTAPPAP